MNILIKESFIIQIGEQLSQEVVNLKFFRVKQHMLTHLVYIIIFVKVIVIVMVMVKMAK